LGANVVGERHALPRSCTTFSGGRAFTHLLDTNICSAHIKRPGGLAHRFFQYAGRLAVPTIVLDLRIEWLQIGSFFC
jgi:hypothetical protein